MTTPLHRTARRHLPRWHRPLMLFAAAMAVLTVVAAVGVFADPRVLTGAPIWLKVFKFSISFSLYGLTLAWMVSLLPRRSRTAHWAATIIVVASVLEMVVIVTQVVRGQTSHYNATSGLNAALWQVMGVSIQVLWLAHLVIAVVLLRGRLADRAAAYGVRLGLVLSLIGMLAAIPMVLESAAPAGVDDITGAHSVGVPDGGPGMPVTMWSTEGGDLRIGHFVGMHALQALPLLALLLGLLARRGGRFGARLDELTRVRLLLVAGGAYGVLTLMLTWQALREQPLLRPDAVSLAALAVLVAVTGTGVVAVLAAGRRTTTDRATTDRTTTDRATTDRAGTDAAAVGDGQGAAESGAQPMVVR